MLIGRKRRIRRAGAIARSQIVLHVRSEDVLYRLAAHEAVGSRDRNLRRIHRRVAIVDLRNIRKRQVLDRARRDDARARIRLRRGTAARLKDVIRGGVPARVLDQRRIGDVLVLHGAVRVVDILRRGLRARLFIDARIGQRRAVAVYEVMALVRCIRVR